MNLRQIKPRAAQEYPKNYKYQDEIYLAVYHSEVLTFVGTLVAAV